MMSIVGHDEGLGSSYERTHFTAECCAWSELFINNNEINSGFVPGNAGFSGWSVPIL